ncbi:MAG TPA: CBS domain-containing protein, partial [Gemmatimonadota bacterium]|nr:CBS domain-containing protein [Gemmatimonadota bacterium]
MLRVRDVMTLDVVTTSPGTSLRDVAETLVAEGVSGLPVVAGDEVVGVVSATDLAAFAADTPGAPTERDLRAEPGLPDGDEDGTEEMPDDPAS